MKYALDPRLLPPGGVPVQCTRCGHVFIAGASAPAPTPAPKVPGVPVRAPNPLSSTLLYGTNAGGSDAPAPTTTQTFGAVPSVPQVPQVAPVTPRAPPGAPAAPSIQKTQTFGAVPQVPPATRPAAPAARPAAPTRPAPAAARPPVPSPSAQAAPAPHTTQVFGSVPPPTGKPPAAAATPSAPPPGSAAPRPTSARPVTVSLPVSPQAAPATREEDPFAALEAVGPAAFSPFDDAPSGPPISQPPGMTPRAGAPERPSPEPAPTPAPPPPAASDAPPPYGHEPRIGVAATTPIELPDEILVQLDRPLSELMGEEAPAEQAPPAAGPAPALNKPLELPPELMDAPNLSARDQGRGKRPAKGGKGRGLLIAAGVLVLALTAFLTSRAWLSKSDVLPHAVQAARDEAVAKFRRDDAASKEEALAELKSLSDRHPQSVELLAEVGIALALHLDDTQVRLTTLLAKEKQLSELIDRLVSTQTPIDWQSRANARKEELATLQRQRFSLEGRSKALAEEAVQVLKNLELESAKEPREVALVRLRARALMSATLGVGNTPALAVKLAQTEQFEWSSLVMAEYVLHRASASPAELREAAAGMESLRVRNSTYLRAYVLGARIALLRHEPAAARTLLNTVITLNPKHELAQQLHAYIEDVERQESEPPPSVKPPPAPAPAPTPAPGPTNEAAPTAPSDSPPTQGTAPTEGSAPGEPSNATSITP
ncbi:hypothetical protein D187_007367 [Cystobacter fuscus DSM 2262]|uniref:Uncharacterized protein n=2 Tax=Cystobacter fuscus TaxID=43 RepID=S9NV32_CYSF2|nr:hypothetical protein D187_007367 [Cystobacter fuscus DSM 2262]